MTAAAPREALCEVATPYVTLAAARVFARAVTPELGIEEARRELTQRACLAVRVGDRPDPGTSAWRVRYRHEGRRYDIDLIVVDDGELAVITRVHVRSSKVEPR